MTNTYDHLAFLALGSNTGERQEHLRAALVALDRLRDVRIDKLSSVYETEPVGMTEQAAFLNMVVQISTNLAPDVLLAALLDIERQGGRHRTVKWGPRTIDIDILLYDDLSLETDRLQIPHPRMLERAFVMIPLQEIARHRKFPGHGQTTIEDLTQKLDGKGVYQWSKRFRTAQGAFELFAN